MNEQILKPMFALVALTFLVLVLIPYKRITAAVGGRLAADDFKYGESANVPPDVSIPNRAMMNLLEMPVLFYLAGMILFVTRKVDTTALVLAWSYVALRTLHTGVHVTYNKVAHRLVPYGLSNVVLAALWMRTAAILFG